MDSEREDTEAMRHPEARPDVQNGRMGYPKRASLVLHLT